MAKEANKSFLWTLAIIELICFILFATLADYRDATGSDGVNSVSKYYAMYQDIHVMIFVGFGLLMTFLHSHGFSSVAMTFLIGVVSIQVGICMVALVHCIGSGHKLEIMLDIPTLIGGDFAAGAVLISYGAVLGRITPTQILVMTFLEIICYAINEYLGYVTIQAVDMGGSIMVHSFGAYFGLAVSYMIGTPKNTNDEGSRYHSDIFAFIGTVFLWMYWPSFNGALAAENNFSQERVVNNTVLSLCACGVAAFFWSHFLEGKLDMVHIQNATLAGGVAIGSSCDLVVGPWAAILVGSFAGTISTMGYVYLTPKLNDKGLYDVCGVHNLHGMPGVLGALTGTVAASLASEELYGENVTEIFSARATRTAGEQGLAQFGALLCALAIAIFGGLVTGAILKHLCDPKESLFHDQDDWLLPEIGINAPQIKILHDEEEIEMGENAELKVKAENVKLEDNVAAEVPLDAI